MTAALTKDLAAAIKARADELRNAKESTDLNNVHPFFRDAIREHREAEAKGGAALSAEERSTNLSSRKGCLEAIVEEVRAATPASGAFSMSEEQLRQAMQSPAPLTDERAETLARQLMGEVPRTATPGQEAEFQAKLSQAMLSTEDLQTLSPERSDLLADQLAGRRRPNPFKENHEEYEWSDEERKKVEQLESLLAKKRGNRPSWLALIDDLIKFAQG